MAIIVKTDNPEKLRASIVSYMSDEYVSTWIIDDEEDITLDREQWRYRAWMHMEVKDGVLAIGIIASRRYKLTKEIYGVFHGTFLTTLLTHFDVDMQSIAVTPMLDTKYDKFPIN